jgi:3-oxoacyl-[acyl-carrier protein] reductase
MQIKDKVAIVTGASGGIGREVSLKLAAQGARMALVARDLDKLNALKAEIEKAGGQAITISTDIVDGKAVEAMAAAVVEQLGAIDILVNCAFWGPPGSLKETTEEFWDRTLDTTLKAPFLCIRAVVPYMRKSGAGRIVNIGSKAGKVGEDNRTAYCAAKWGLEGLNAALQEELTRDNIHVHMITPAATNTAWWPGVGAKLSSEVLARFVPPESIADAVVFAISAPDQVIIPDIPVYNFRNPFEGKGSPFAE